ncbi:NUDIX domain-containing protein [Patescibacteria group bacterium]|nr:MAG: NUDIX domain-containing protein [Patescibacteria group bacterium]
MFKCAAYIIPRRDNEVLLSLRKNTGYMDGYYSLVAGHVEANEVIEEGAIREAHEEAGINIRPDQLQFVFLQHRQSADPIDEYIDVFFEVSEWDGEFTNMEPEKCGGLDWFDIDQLPESTIPDIAYVLTNYRNGQHYASQRKVTA